MVNLDINSPSQDFFFHLFNRHSLLKILPALRILNGEMLNSCSESCTEEQHYELELGRFLVLCQSQIREFNLLIENYITGKGYNCYLLLAVIKIYNEIYTND